MTVNFEHNEKSLRRVRHCLHRAQQAIRFGDTEAAEFERVDLRGAIRQITDNTASNYVDGKIGKYRNFRYWTEDALAMVDRGEKVTRALTGEHAIEVDLLARSFIEAVRTGEAAREEEAAAWLAARITIVTMTNDERRRYGLDKKHAHTWEEFLAEPFARFPPALRRSIKDRRRTG